VWCTPSYDADSDTIFFGTDTQQRSTPADEGRSQAAQQVFCAMIAVDAATGKEKGYADQSRDVWNLGLRAYDPKTGLYKDHRSATRPNFLPVDQRPARARHRLRLQERRLLHSQTPTPANPLRDAALHRPPVHPPINLNPRTIALPAPIGGIHDRARHRRESIFTNASTISPYTNEDPKKPTVFRDRRAE